MALCYTKLISRKPATNSTEFIAILPPLTRLDCPCLFRGIFNNYFRPKRLRYAKVGPMARPAGQEGGQRGMEKSVAALAMLAILAAFLFALTPQTSHYFASNTSR